MSDSDLTWTAGEQVLLTVRMGWSFRTCIASVDRVMPSGMPVVQGLTYRCNGTGRGKNNPNRIAKMTDETRNEIEARQRQETARNAWYRTVQDVDARKLPADVLERIVAAIRREIAGHE